MRPDGHRWLIPGILEYVNNGEHRPMLWLTLPQSYLVLFMGTARWSLARLRRP